MHQYKSRNIFKKKFHLYDDCFRRLHRFRDIKKKRNIQKLVATCSIKSLILKEKYRRKKRERKRLPFYVASSTCVFVCMQARRLVFSSLFVFIIACYFMFMTDVHERVQCKSFCVSEYKLGSVTRTSEIDTE